MLYQKQIEIFKQIKPNGMIPAGTSTGKTLISLFYYLKYFKDYPLVVIAPAVKVHEGGWERELKVACNFLKRDVPPIEVISYSKIVNHEFKEAFYILDEAHYIKNSTSQRGKAVKKGLKKAKGFLMLTATPGSKIEEFANYFIIWEFIKNKTQFLKKYTIQSKSYFGNFMEIKGYQNEQEFYNLLNSKCTDKLNVEDIFEMPEKIHKFIEFNPCSEYKVAKNTRIGHQGEILDSQAKLCAYLRANCSSKDKLEYLAYLVNEIKEQWKNVLIFYNFKKELEEIKSKIKIDYLINGEIKEFPVKEEFKKQKSKVTLVQIQAGGAGIELTYNSRVIYYSPTYSYQDYEQSLGRAYRKGQEHKLIIYKFMTKNTIEKDVWKSLENKEDFNDKLWIK
ncbi:helicase-related protein [Streptobacillus moniliformis]|uniref:helicase-related protein n=1 Tax=Streptobacillus moniliformis TaxID=34105 RepID=UPI0007E4CD64|nr:helicase-related protein [Streptobacillus moniliformis]